MNPRWEVKGDRQLFDRLEPKRAQWLRAERGDGAFLPWADGRLYAKWSPLGGRAGLRHALRSLAGLSLPRLREFDNLTWLRDHGFRAPRPLMAAAAWHGRRPRLQLLCTAAVEGTGDLGELLARDEPARAAQALADLAAETARMHALGFVHRDLFLRNLLVPEDGEARVVVLDAWRGGPAQRLGGARGDAYDVGCLLHDARLQGLEQAFAGWLETYIEMRTVHGAPVDPRALAWGIARTRAQRSRREARARRRRARSPKAGGGAG